MRKQRNNEVGRILKQLQKKDMYSLLLFTLFALKDNPDFLTLTELCYVLDNDNLAKFLKYFGGMTLTIPTVEDLQLVTKGIVLYEYVDLQNGEFESGVRSLSDEDFTQDQIKQMYLVLKEVLDKYEFATNYIE